MIALRERWNAASLELPEIRRRLALGQQFNLYEIAEDDDEELPDDFRRFLICVGTIDDHVRLGSIQGGAVAELVEATLKLGASAAAPPWSPERLAETRAGIVTKKMIDVPQFYIARAYHFGGAPKHTKNGVVRDKLCTVVVRESEAEIDFTIAGWHRNNAEIDAGRDPTTGEVLNPEFDGITWARRFDIEKHRIGAVTRVPDGRFWLSVQCPGQVPSLKGPFQVERTAETLREFMAANPAAYLNIITVGADGSPLIQHGPECLQMLDGRSMNTGRKHNRRVREAEAAVSATPEDGE